MFSDGSPAARRTPDHFGQILVPARQRVRVIAISADPWPDQVRLSDLEPRFVCEACGKKGADVRSSHTRPRWNAIAAAPRRCSSTSPAPSAPAALCLQGRPNPDRSDHAPPQGAVRGTGLSLQIEPGLRPQQGAAQIGGLRHYLNYGTGIPRKIQINRL